MKPSFTIGSGKPPAYASHIERKKDGTGIIKLVGRGNIAFDTKEDLWQRMKELAEENILFAVGGMSWGADDEFQTLMEERKEEVTYLRIAWKNQKEWTIHEVVPGTKEWDHVTLKKLMS